MLRIALAQDDFRVGDIAGNRARISALIARARDELGADLIVFPELAVTGYPPEDLLLRPDFMAASAAALGAIAAAVRGIDVVIGYPRAAGERRFNSLAWLRDGRIIASCDKQTLPNYAVFDERRYFTPGEGGGPLVVEVAGVQVGVMICEDGWTPDAARAATQAGAQVIVSANASPFFDGHQAERAEMLAARQRETGRPLLYLNAVGGQDELVFDGRSLAIDGRGRLSPPAPLCKPALLCVDCHPDRGRLDYRHWPAGQSGHLEVIWQVLVCALRDYTVKNGFESVVLGLSGGMDSALVLALAADAVGAQRVHAVMMPSRHTSELSLILASEQVESLGTRHETISIEPIYRAQLAQLAEPFAGRRKDFTEENLQARARGNVIMALSNKLGHLPLATGNKSELAVGYSTLYGDMCGGFSPLRDVLKTLVYELARWRNTVSPAIPAGVIERPPSAELAPDQLDQDRLPPYPVLDEIITRYVEGDESVEEIAAAGFDPALVRRIAGMILAAEFKRRQGAPGPRITRRAFGRDRRYPITSGWRARATDAGA